MDSSKNKIFTESEILFVLFTMSFYYFLPLLFCPVKAEKHSTCFMDFVTRRLTGCLHGKLF